MIKKLFMWVKSLFTNNASSVSVLNLGKGNNINISQSTVKRPECVGVVYGKPFPDPSIMKQHLMDAQKRQAKNRTTSTSVTPVSQSSSNRKLDDDDSYMYNAGIQSLSIWSASSDDGGSYSSGSCDSSSSGSCD